MVYTNLHLVSLAYGIKQLNTIISHTRTEIHTKGHCIINSASDYKQEYIHIYILYAYNFFGVSHFLHMYKLSIPYKNRVNTYLQRCVIVSVYNAPTTELQYAFLKIRKTTCNSRGDRTIIP